MTQGRRETQGIGARLRAARVRLGWSRETLAFHSGISWPAIAQVEAGRRTNVRPSTLAALSGPLGVTIDYLVNGAPAEASMLQHSAFTYDGDEQFQSTMGTFLAEGVERCEGLSRSRRRTTSACCASASGTTPRRWSSWSRGSG
jgi:transcriptional regulator with XRE-family HTH domain